MEKRFVTLWASIIIIISVLSLILLSIIGVPFNIMFREYVGCHHSIPDSLSLILCLLLIFASILFSYYFNSKKMEEQLNKQTDIFLTLINKKDKEKGALPEHGNQINKQKQAILKFFNSDERKIIEMLIESKGNIMQYQINKKENMNKVKTHRAVKSLELKGIIRIESYGKTKKLFLNEDIKELLLYH